MSNYSKSLEKAGVDQPLPAPLPAHHTCPSSSPPSEAASIQQPRPAVKSDHLKLTFPTFGRPSDDADPLLYLTRCQDFLALHPLADADILATFRTVLYGTARHAIGGKLLDLLLLFGTTLILLSSQLSSLRTMKMSWLSESELEHREKKNQSETLPSHTELYADVGSPL